MIPRISIVDHLNISALTFTSVSNIGDAQLVDCTREYLTVKREAERFFGFKGNEMKRYNNFSVVPAFEPIYEQLTMSFNHDIPYIKVSEISIVAVAGSVVHIGSGDSINLESKIVNIF